MPSCSVYLCRSVSSRPLLSTIGAIENSVITKGRVVLPHRIELWTSPLPRECSTTELRQRPEAGGAGYAIAPAPVQPLPPAETGVPRQLAAGRRVCLRFGRAGRRNKMDWRPISADSHI